MGGLNLMDPSAERVVYEKSANQPQPQLPSSTDRLQRKKKQLDNNITLPAKSIQTFSPLLSKIYSNKKPLTLKVFYCCSVACLCCCLSFFHFFFVGFCFYCGQNFTSLMGQILLHEFENLLQMLVHSGLVEI
jgi:hypothetical protein